MGKRMNCTFFVCFCKLMRSKWSYVFNKNSISFVFVKQWQHCDTDKKKLRYIDINRELKKQRISSCRCVQKYFFYISKLCQSTETSCARCSLPTKTAAELIKKVSIFKNIFRVNYYLQASEISQVLNNNSSRKNIQLLIQSYRATTIIQRIMFFFVYIKTCCQLNLLCQLSSELKKKMRKKAENHKFKSKILSFLLPFTKLLGLESTKKLCRYKNCVDKLRNQSNVK